MNNPGEIRSSNLSTMLFTKNLWRMIDGPMTIAKGESGGAGCPSEFLAAAHLRKRIHGNMSEHFQEGLVLYRLG